MDHDTLKTNAKNAAEALFEDRSVNQQETLDSLEDLVEYIEEMIDTLEG